MKELPKLPEKYHPILKGLLDEWLEQYKDNAWHKSVKEIRKIFFDDKNKQEKKEERKNDNHIKV